MQQSSKKKMMHDNNRKSAKKGANTRLPTQNISDKGNPDAIKKGNEMRVKKSWS